MIFLSGTCGLEVITFIAMCASSFWLPLTNNYKENRTEQRLKYGICKNQKFIGLDE